MSHRHDDISQRELRDRVLYALLGPAARTARVLRTPLGTLRDWLEIGYFHDARKQDLKLKEIAELMEVSMSKVALLSRALKENFIREDAEAALPRRIEFMLWAGPLSPAKIKQVLPDADADDVDETLRALVDEGRIHAEGEGDQVHYGLTMATDRRVWDSWLARIDGLNNALRNVADAVYARFFTDEEAAFARTVTFHVRREQLGELQAFYEQLFARIVELDGEACDDPDALALSLSMFWAPHDYLDTAIPHDASLTPADDEANR